MLPSGVLDLADAEKYGKPRGESCVTGKLPWKASRDTQKIIKLAALNIQKLAFLYLGKSKYVR
jgi:hypothetical protein